MCLYVCLHVCVCVPSSQHGLLATAQASACSFLGKLESFGEQCDAAFLSGSSSAKAEVKAWGGGSQLRLLKVLGLYFRTSLSIATECHYAGHPSFFWEGGEGER